MRSLPNPALKPTPESALVLSECLGGRGLARVGWVRRARPKSMKDCSEGDARRNPTNGDEVLISVACWVTARVGLGFQTENRRALNEEGAT